MSIAVTSPHNHLIHFVPQYLSFHLIQVGLRDGILKKFSYNTNGSISLMTLCTLKEYYCRCTFPPNPL